jgi:hypothetical protein
MAKLCAACQELRIAGRGICDECRRRILKSPVVPTLRPGLWKLAAFFITLLFIGSGLIAAAVLTHRSINPGSRLQRPKAPVVYEVTMVMEQGTRKVYPYSIVPGGAENLDEAKRAMNDPGVKATYAGVDFNKLRAVKLTKNLSGYVSYRWGEKIYWTSKMLTLHAGEIVFTDGINLVRGRCLNNYSPQPMLPTRPEEPSEKVLDMPVELPVIAYSFPKLPVATPELPPPPEELTPTVPILPAVPSTPGKTGGGIWFPLIPIIPPIHRHPGPTPPGVPLPPPGLIVVTPEPNFQWLLAGIFLLLVSLYGLRRRSRIHAAAPE